MARKQRSIHHLHNLLASSSNKITSFIKFMHMKITKFMLVQSKSFSTDEKHKVFCRWSFYHRRSSSPVPPMSSSATSPPSESPPLLSPTPLWHRRWSFSSSHYFSRASKHKNLNQFMQYRLNMKDRHSVSTTSINPPMFCSYIIRRRTRKWFACCSY